MAANIFQQNYSEDVRHKLILVDHQQAHALSTIGTSGFNKALVIVLDSWGDGASELIGSVSDDIMEIIQPVKDSLGAFYTRGTYYLGYRQHDEYKVMGLAPYGDSDRYQE